MKIKESTDYMETRFCVVLRDTRKKSFLALASAGKCLETQLKGAGGKKAQWVQQLPQCGFTGANASSVCCLMLARAFATPRRSVTENRDKVVDGVALVLYDALGDPHQIAHFLLFQLDVRIEAGCRDTSHTYDWLASRRHNKRDQTHIRTKVHLALEREFSHLDVTLVERVVDRLAIDALALMHLPDLAVHWKRVQCRAKRGFIASFR